MKYCHVLVVLNLILLCIFDWNSLHSLHPYISSLHCSSSSSCSACSCSSTSIKLVEALGETGSYSEIENPEEDDAVQSAVNHLNNGGLSELNTGITNTKSGVSSMFVNGIPQLEVVKVISAEKQVVAGLNIRLKLLCRNPFFDVKHVADAFFIAKVVVYERFDNQITVSQWERAAVRLLHIDDSQQADEAVGFLTSEKSNCEKLKNMFNLWDDLCSGATVHPIEPLSIAHMAFSEQLSLNEPQPNSTRDNFFVISIPKNKDKRDQVSGVVVVRSTDDAQSPFTMEHIEDYSNSQLLSCCACRSDAGPRFIMFLFGTLFAGLLGFCFIQRSAISQTLQTCLGSKQRSNDMHSDPDNGIGQENQGSSNQREFNSMELQQF